MALQYNHISSFLLTNSNSVTKIISYVGLGLGIVLLLASLQLFVNIQQLLGNQNPRRGGYDYISITKDVTNETMGQVDKNLFTPDEINKIDSQSTVQAVSPLIANRFQVELSAGNIIPFSTSLFVESVDDSFLDTLPASFKWRPGQEFLPIIVSSDFLQMYNVFAPGYGLPQISEETASKILVNITCTGKTGLQQTFRGSIVAFSDRINSIIVPKSFLEWANQRFASTDQVKASRLYVQTKDANDPAFLKFLDDHHYRVNRDKIKFGRIKGILQIVVSALAIFGLLVVILALMLFSFYLQLIISRSRENLQLLMTLGYAPGWLTNRVAMRWTPVYATIIVVALILVSAAQWQFAKLTRSLDANITPFVNWSVVALAVLLICLTAFSNYRMIRKQLYAIG